MSMFIFMMGTISFKEGSDVKVRCKINIPFLFRALEGFYPQIPLFSIQYIIKLA